MTLLKVDLKKSKESIFCAIRLFQISDMIFATFISLRLLLLLLAPFTRGFDCQWSNLSFISLNTNTSSNIQFVRRYLPSSPFNNINCDLKISTLVNINILSLPKVPYGIKFSTISLGRFVYYNALMNYNFFNGGKVNVIADIDMKSFKWSQGIDVCSGEYANWNCAFLSLSSLSNLSVLSINSPTKNSYTSKERNIAQKILSFRENKKNSLVQMLLYSKMMNLITRPTLHSKKFLIEYLVILFKEKHFLQRNKNFSECLDDEYESDCRFKSYDQFVLFTEVYNNSLSLHIRAGDSCDFWIDTNPGKLFNG